MRVVVMSGRRLFGESVAAVLRVRSEFTAVNPVTSPESLLSVCELCSFDAAVIDADQDATAVLPICHRLREQFRSIHLVVVYDKLSPTGQSALRRNGVNTLVPFSRGLGALVTALRSRPSSVPGRQPAGLSRRQRDVLMLLASGHSVPEIATMLDISPGTVENHKRRMYVKLAARTTVHAVARAAEFGMLGGDDDEPARPDPQPQRPARYPSGDAGHALLTVVHGSTEPVLHRVVELLIRHQVPVSREYLPRTARSDHWSRWYRGPLVVVLVDPTEDDWSTALALVRPVIVHYSTPVSAARIDDAFDRGAAAVLPADRLDDRLVDLLSVVAQGYHVLDRTHTSPPPRGLQRNRPAPDLTARECDILRSIARGHTVRETARTLGIAAKTVENAQSYLFRKLGAHNRPSALVVAHSLGLLPTLPAPVAAVHQLTAGRRLRPAVTPPSDGS